MKKRLFAALLLVAMLLSLAACGSKKSISEADAKKIVLEDLGKAESEVSGMHVHVATHEGVGCYSIHVTVDGVSMEYMIHGATGDIISKGEGGH